MLLRDKVKAMPGSKYMQTKDAGELEKIDFQHIPIIIEQPVGSIREGTKPDGTSWQVNFQYPYGYVKGTQGADGEGIDVFIGPNKDAAFAYLVRQNKGNRYDEDKVLLGFNNEEEAKAAYFAHHDEPNDLADIVVMSMDDFKMKMEYYIDIKALQDSR